MSITIIQEQLKQYHCQNPLEEAQAIKEITQEIILMALSRSDFFTQAEFHGGTALRILYGLPRFSEDLDFALLNPDPEFQLSPYLENLAEELTTFGYQLEVLDRSKVDNIIKKAFIKDEAIGKLLLLDYAAPQPHQKILI
jgi:predicted nucleotidyltransferase component of viral defense system